MGRPACHGQVEIAKVDLLRRVEVTVADVSATANGELPVHDPGLVLHAVVQPVARVQELDRVAECSPGTELEGVVESDLDAGVLLKRGQRAFAPPDVEVIEQQPHLHIAPLREDGATYGMLTWIWSVAVSGDLYVRAYNGRSSRWYQAALRQKSGRITAAGMTREGAFEPVEGAINDRIDEAYRAKYGGNPYLGAMIGAQARAATIKVTPREAHANMAQA